MSNAHESSLYQIDPLSEDSYGDGLKDGDELRLDQTNPLESDSDSSEDDLGSDPNDNGMPVPSTGNVGPYGDSDADGMANGMEVHAGPSLPGRKRVSNTGKLTITLIDQGIFKVDEGDAVIDLQKQ